MPTEQRPAANAPREPQPSPAAEARRLAREAVKGALATLAVTSGNPYASLVTVATEPDGTPLMLLSRLALHTQNLRADPRASLLLDATSPIGDPLAGGRVTLIGRFEQADAGAARPRFLARHPEAAMYAGFADFAFYRLALDGAHYIGGFGRIVDIPAADLKTSLADAERLIEAETEIVEHMNEDHADALALYAAMSGEASATAPSGVGAWRMTGIDPDGIDLLAAGGRARRVAFAERVTSPDGARRELVRLAKLARERTGDGA